MKRSVFTMRDGSQMLVCETLDGNQTIATRAQSWATWSAPTPIDYRDDDPPEAVEREGRYLAETDRLAEAQRAAKIAVTTLRSAVDAGVPPSVLADALAVEGVARFTTEFWREIVSFPDD